MDSGQNVSQALPLTCPDCGYQAETELSNAAIWKLEFICPACEAQIPGRDFYPRQQLRTRPDSVPDTCPCVGQPFVAKAKSLAAIMRYALYELIDPRSGGVIWVGAGALRNMRRNALSPIHSAYKEAMIAEIKQNGAAPVPRLVSKFATKEEAMLAKIDRCAAVGFPYKGPSRLEVEQLQRTRGARRRRRR